MNLRIYIVEDDPLHLDHLLMVLQELGHRPVGSQQDAMRALGEIEELEPDIVLTDIDLNGHKNGVVLARQLLRHKSAATIIFTTTLTDKAMIEVALSSVEAKVYLIKPITAAALHAALLTASRKDIPEVSNIKADHIFVRSGTRLKRINYADITYLEADAKNYCTIHTLQKEKASVRASLTELAAKLPAGLFVQVHRAYTIHFGHVESLNEKEQSLVVNGVPIPIGRTFRKQVYSLLNLL